MAQRKMIASKEQLQCLYDDDEKTMDEIAKIYDCTKATVWKWFKNYNLTARKMVGENHGSWKGGKVKKTGYWAIWNPTHPHANNVGYVKEHILVLEKALGRNIGKNEFIHHINFDRLDNRLENLWLTNGHKQHLGYHSTLLKLVKPLIEKGIIGFNEGGYYLK